MFENKYFVYLLDSIFINEYIFILRHFTWLIINILENFVLVF